MSTLMIRFEDAEHRRRFMAWLESNQGWLTDLSDGAVATYKSKPKIGMMTVKMLQSSGEQTKTPNVGIGSI